MIWLFFLLPVILIVVVLVVIWKLSQKMLFFKPDEGVKPISKTKMLSNIMKLDKNVFNVEKEEEGFKINWVVTDSKWVGIVGKNWENVTYSAFGRLDNETKTVKLYEKVISAKKVTGIQGFRTSSYTTNGPTINTKVTVKQYSIKEDGSIGEVMNYKFSPNEIKSVLKQICNSNGWALQIVFSNHGLK